MWRRTYLLLVVLRLLFALSPSYLHPDEHFQGPEVIAGSFFVPEHTGRRANAYTSPLRPRLFIPRSPDMGVHLRLSYT